MYPSRQLPVIGKIQLILFITFFYVITEMIKIKNTEVHKNAKYGDLT